MDTRKRQKKPRIKSMLKCLAVLIVVLIVAIFQDRVNSGSSDFPIDESVSFLFNTFFLWIPPISWILWIAFSRIEVLSRIQPIFLKRILFMLLATTLQIILFAGMVQVISTRVYEQEIDFAGNLRHILAGDLYKYLLIYSVVGLVLIRKNTLR